MEAASGCGNKVRSYRYGAEIPLAPDERLMVEFDRVADAEPFLIVKAETGTRVTLRPAEGPQVIYVCAGGDWETYLPRYTLLRFRRLSVEVSAPSVIAKVKAIPVSCIVLDGK